MKSYSSIFVKALFITVYVLLSGFTLAEDTSKPIVKGCQPLHYVTKEVVYKNGKYFTIEKTKIFFMLAKP